MSVDTPEKRIITKRVIEAGVWWAKACRDLSEEIC